MGRRMTVIVIVMLIVIGDFIVMMFFFCFLQFYNVPLTKCAAANLPVSGISNL